MRYRYKSIDRSGNRINGQIEANDEAEARRFVLGNDEHLLELSSDQARKWLTFERNTAPDLSTSANFAVELSGLLKAGAPLKKALDIMAEGKGKVSHLSREAIKTIEIGGSLSNALRQAGGSANLLAEFAAAGEAGAGLHKMLETAGHFLRTREETLSKIRSAFAYPLFICLLAVAALAVMVLYVAPSLASVVEEAEGAGAILFLANLGNWAQANSTVILLSLAGLVGVFFFASQNTQFKKQASLWAWSVPVIGSVRRDLDMGQACEVLSSLLDCGRSMESAMAFAGAASSPTVEVVFSRINERLRDGQVLSVAFSDEAALPQDVRRLAVLGENSSKFSHAIRQAGQICHARALRKLERVAAMAGPFLVIGVGGMIAALMLTVLGSLATIGGGAL